MKTIITHIHPDLDAITSTWLIKRYMPGWEDAGIAFVAAGTTYKNQLVDSDDSIIHVDTGLGKFDHHQNNDHTCASRKVYEYLVDHEYLEANSVEPLDRITNFVTSIDHFEEVKFPDPSNDRYEFGLSQIIEGLNVMFKDGHIVSDYVFIILDSLVILFQNKIVAEKEIHQGFSFTSKWGKTLAMETKNEETMKLALKTGYCLVVRKDPEKGNIRIKTLPYKKYNLTKLHTKLVEADPKATWFLHSSKNILLNGSSKGPNMIPSVLPLKKVIEIIRSI